MSKLLCLNFKLVWVLWAVCLQKWCKKRGESKQWKDHREQQTWSEQNQK